MIDPIELPATTPDENPALALSWVPPYWSPPPSDELDLYLEGQEALSSEGRRLVELIRDQAVDAYHKTQALTKRLEVPGWVYDVQRSLGKSVVLASGLLGEETPGYAYEALTGLMEEVRAALEAPSRASDADVAVHPVGAGVPGALE